MVLSNSALMRAADNTAINGLRIASAVLMENAAGHLAEAARGLARENKSAYIFCGSGNNGGDGVAAAAYLLRDGFTVRVLLCGRRTGMTPDTREMELRVPNDMRAKGSSPVMPKASRASVRASRLK